MSYDILPQTRSTVASLHLTLLRGTKQVVVAVWFCGIQLVEVVDMATGQRFDCTLDDHARIETAWRAAGGRAIAI